MASQLLLFRQEAIDFQRQHRQQWGQITPLQPLSTKVTSWFIAATVAVVVAFLFFAQYARKETVIGYLTPTAGTAKIFAFQQGTIKEIYVKEGQQVKKGQPLLAVETSQIAANGQDINASMLATLEAQRNLLKGQIAAEQERTNPSRHVLLLCSAGSRLRYLSFRPRSTLRTKELGFRTELVSSVTGLRAKGLISEPEYRKRGTGSSRAKAEVKFSEATARRPRKQAH